MPVHIDEIDTQVQVAPTPASSAAAPAEPEWQKEARLRATLVKLLLDESRTAARGNED
jgi:hypothetical protein